MDDIAGCFACDLSHGRIHLPGGLIHRTDYWVVEHCLGPLGIGTLIVKPRRHVVHVSDLTLSEAAEMGPLLRLASSVVTALARPEQVYVCLWSHGPVHIHFVVQPVDGTVMADFAARGPKLQVAMFETAEAPAEAQVEAFCDAARLAFRGS